MPSFYSVPLHLVALVCKVLGDGAMVPGVLITEAIEEDANLGSTSHIADFVRPGTIDLQALSRRVLDGGNGRVFGHPGALLIQPALLPLRSRAITGQGSRREDPDMKTIKQRLVEL